MIANPAKIDSNFLFYSLKYYRRDLIMLAKGAAQQNLSAAVIKQFAIPVPPVSTQQRIAKILSSYDDLIEINRRRIALLEEMARALFEEWFVRFRFPGHEIMATLDNLLPEGWKMSELGDLCEGKRGIQTGPFGSQLHKEDYSVEGVPVTMPKNLIGLRIVTDGIARVPEHVAQSLRRHIMREGDIVYGRRGDIGRRAYISGRQDGWFCGTGCLRLRPDRSQVSPRYMFDALGTPQTEGAIKGRATGSTMPNLSAGVMQAVPIVEPPLALQEQYAGKVAPIKDLVDALFETNSALAASRDLLLPRLISGELTLAIAARELEDFSTSPELVDAA